MDPDDIADLNDIAELKTLAPNVFVQYRPHDVALICTLLPTETKAKELPPSKDMEDCIKSLFAVVAVPHQEDQFIRIDVVRIDCEELRLCLVAYSYPSFENSEVLKIFVSFSVVPVLHLSNTHRAYSSLVEEVAQLVTKPSSTPEVLAADVPQLRLGHFQLAELPGAAEQLRQVKPPSRSRRLCHQFGVTIGVVRTTTFQVDDEGGFTIQQKSRLRANRPGAKVTGGAVMGLEPNVNLTVEKNLPDTTYVPLHGGKHLKLVFSKNEVQQQAAMVVFLNAFE